MAVQIKQVVNDVILKAGAPDSGRLSRWVILRLLHLKMDHYRARLQITDENRFLERWPLTVTPGNDEFAVDAAQAGKWLLCHTVDDSDPNHVRREVELVKIQNMDLFYLGPPSGGGSVGSPHVARSFTFFTEQGQTKVKVTPKHDQSAQYLFWYQPDRPLPPKLQDNYPLLENFVNVVACDTAVAALAYMKAKIVQELRALSLEANAETAQIQLAALSNELKSYDSVMNDLRLEMLPYLEVLKVYETQSMDEQSGPRIGWGGANYYNPGWGDVW